MISSWKVTDTFGTHPNQANFPQLDEWNGGDDLEGWVDGLLKGKWNMKVVFVYIYIYICVVLNHVLRTRKEQEMRFCYSLVAVGG